MFLKIKIIQFLKIFWILLIIYKLFINYLLSYFAYLFSEPIGTHVLFEELGNLDNFFLYY